MIPNSSPENAPTANLPEIDSIKSKPTIMPVKNAWLIIISILLFVLVILNMYQIVTSYQQNVLASQRAADYEARVLSATSTLAKQQEILSNMADGFSKDIYDDPNVETIYQQLFVATEYNFHTLQAIAILNTQIIQLLSSLP